MTCTCHVGPGKLEAEGPLTALLVIERGSDDYVSYGGGSWGALEIGPIDPPDASERSALIEHGYCDACVAQFVIDCASIKAVTFGEDSQGFAWSQEWDDATAAQAAYDADEAEMLEADPDEF